jgi:hypothetical protein
MAAEPKSNWSQQDAEMTPRSLRLSSQGFDQAKDVVENWLGLGGFIDSYKMKIYDRLENCQVQVAGDAATESQSFFTESLPLISSIIHIGSSRVKFIKAIEHIKETWPNADPDFLLSALTVIYLVRKHQDVLTTSLKNEQEMARWERISQDLEMLIT